ncbi:Rne/Rng family ribonuclease [Edaphobacter sp. HDX4]|uniref:Rne/Rng family ribonuclease n=1 Tax=Edaphobacter sp. HDX4 TaxID=2794064 RepID=UPI002FE58144
MSKEIYISSTPHETRLAIVENDALAEIYYERENEYTLAGSIYNGRVTRVLPGMQSSFVDIGLERDAFLYITDFMEEAGDSADFESEGSKKNGKRDRGTREPITLEGGEPASEDQNRGDRGRGRRDRKDRGSRDRQDVAQPTQASEDYSLEETYAPESLEAPEELAAAGRNEVIGEGAPGADGSRRWRGRRGRRRGRGRQYGSETGAEAPVEAASGNLPVDLEVSEAVQETLPEAPLEQELRQENFSRQERGGREDRGRGGRDRERRERRMPRGFAPKTSLYGLEGASADEFASDAAPAEPLILPGESLSKYRKGGEPATQTSKETVSVPAVPSAPGFEIPAGWDGGLTLPGESLSRRRSSPQTTERYAAPVVVPEATEEVVPEPQAAVQEAVAPEERTEPGKIQEPMEYEPEEASASYRFDPIAPSEFRQSASVEEDAAVALEEVAATHSELPHAEIEETEWAAQPMETSQEEISTSGGAETSETHEVTSIHATGEMVSPTPVVDPVEAEAEHQAFEPGASVIEEQAISGDDYDTTMLHASSIEELDDLDEEETLEGAADLGAMIREMSIDQITSANLVEGEEEEDFEEEDAVEDGSFGAEYSTFEEAPDESSHVDSFEEEEPVATVEEAAPDQARRDIERRHGRRDRRGRDRSRHAGGNSDQDRSGGRGRGRSSMQATDLPAITELLKPGQEILVQIAKEPIAKKGARITSHIALPGRFLVFMPTVNHTGVSRKIESDGERRRLKEILLSEKGDAPGGFIVRTAASGATEEELRSDLRFLLNLWADIKQRSESSKSPALIYHDLNLVERILRDQVTDTFSAIWVDTETEYERVLRFLQRFQPSLIRRVKLYTKETPLFEQFGITEEINKALRSKVWLKSGGSIVINQTEALVAIDINTGKYVGKTARLEDTIVKTNLDAIPEIVRQIRLRDLGGIIIIDFIDMDERKNRNRVMAALEEELKRDRAPSKILQFNDFGLVAITRKRVKQSLERTLSTPCNICAGTGMVKSPVTVCNDIYVEMRKMSKHLDRGDVMLRVHPEVVRQLKSSTKWLQEMEEMVGKTILVKSDPSLHPEQFDIH